MLVAQAFLRAVPPFRALSTGYRVLRLVDDTHAPDPEVFQDPVRRRRRAQKCSPQGGITHCGTELANNGTQHARMRFNAVAGQSGTKAR